MPNEVPWLKDILRSYPGSPHYGSIETRGLDSEFAWKTYVETGLEAKLLDAIRKGRVRLVVLCGNAGDGKTAFLQYIAEKLGVPRQSSAKRIWSVHRPSGLSIRANLDGSAAYRGKSSDELLDELLQPFQDGPPRSNIVHLLAVNDGRLLEWVEGYTERRGSTRLTEWLWSTLAGEQNEPAEHVWFIDLNR
ncbi:MAG: hypothetical protein ACLQNE_38720 [Thermoguttaceae bacterium]